MMRSQTIELHNTVLSLSDAVARTRAGQTDPLTRIMQANNQRLFRIARGILRDDAEAEDVVQDTFIKAFTNAGALRDASKISAWLGKIAVNLARDRLRQMARRARVFEPSRDADVVSINHMFQEDIDQRYSPERLTAMGDVRRMIETEIDQLPDGFREVFVMRVVEQLSIEETSALLDLPQGTVKTRLLRAKTRLRKGLEGRLSVESLHVFPFGGDHCARTSAQVIKHLQQEGAQT